MEFGLYIHYPYCRRICPFCDFVVRKKARGAQADFDDQRYTDALIAELRLRKAEGAGGKLHTIYFGGGTPSLMPLEELARLLKAIQNTFDCREISEITLEVDPTTVDFDKVSAIRNLGVERFSLGVQSFDDQLLNLLGREYQGEDADQLIKMCAAARIPKLSADLIFGIPDQSLDMWRRDLQTLAGYQGIQHISLYNLSVSEPGRFMQKMHKLKKSLPVDDLQVRMYEVAVAELAQYGFEQYEITAWAKPGCQAIHNQNYWLGEAYVGIGVGAHSYQPGAMAHRSYNSSSLATYFSQIESSQLATANNESLNHQQQLLEFMMLRLRMRRGIGRTELQHWLGPGSHEYNDIIRRLVTAGLLEWCDDRLQLPTQRMMLSNEILSEFCLT